MKLTFCLILAAALAAGCTRSRRADYSSGLNASYAQVRPPIFLTGSMAILLTNAHGYSAHAVLAAGSSNATDTVSGDVLVRGSKVMFAQAPNPALPKSFRAGLITFIWDVVDNKGYVLSEAMQGYAPFSLSVHPTNVVIKAAGAAPQKIEGYRCGEETAAVFLTDGTSTLFHVWRALDLNGLPVRISDPTNAESLVLSFSKLLWKEPAAELFQPPDGFTKYDSAEGMMSELTIRQQNLKRRVTGFSGESDLYGGQDARRSR